MEESSGFCGSIKNAVFVLPWEFSGVQECSSDMWEAFQKCLEAGFQRQWVEESKCLDITASTKIDVFVMEKFEGNVFQSLKTNNLVLGPRYLLDCLQRGTHPGTAAILNPAMRGVVACLTGFTKDDEHAFQQMIEYMGGTCHKVLSPMLTHVVADAVRTARYDAAIKQGLRVVTKDWITAVWEANLSHHLPATDTTFDSHRVPVFLNIIVSCETCLIDEEPEILEMIRQNGGELVDSTDPDVQIIITKHGLERDKTEYTVANSVPRLSSKWVIESLRKGYALPFKEFLIPCQRNSVGIRVKSSEVSQDNKVCQDNNVRVRASVIQEAQATELNFNTPTGRMKENVRKTDNCLSTSGEKEVSAQIYGGVSRILELKHGVRNFQYSPDEETIPGSPQALSKKQIRMSRSANKMGSSNAQTSVKPVAERTQSEHSCALSEITELRYNCKKAEHSPDQETVPPSPRLRSKKNRIPQNLESRKMTSCIPENSQILTEPSTSNEGDTEVVQSASRTVKLIHCSRKPLHSPDPETVPPTPRALSKKNLLKLKKLKDPPLPISQMSKMNPIFQGLLFDISLPKKEAFIMNSIITALGGDFFTENSTKIPDFAVVPLRGTAEKICKSENRPKEVVTSLYIDACVRSGALVKIEYFDRQIPMADVKPLLGLVIQISGYPEGQTIYLSALVEALGAGLLEESPEETDTARTHFICPLPEGQEYTTAVLRRIQVVTAEWLKACAEVSRFVDETPFLVGLKESQGFKTPEGQDHGVRNASIE